MDGNTDSVDISLSKLMEIVTGREAWHAAVHGAAESEMASTTNKRLFSINSCAVIYINIKV